MSYRDTPYVISDESLKSNNAFKKENLARRKQEIENQYLPRTLQANAISKEAYAALTGPQFLAKLMGNEHVVANSPQLQNPDTIETLYEAGMGNRSGNALSKPSIQSGRPESQYGSQNLLPYPPILQSKLADRAQSSQSISPEDMKEGMVGYNQPLVPNRDQPEQNATLQPTYAENVGKYKGVVEEGKVLGNKRAAAIDDLDQQYQQAIQSEIPLQHLGEIINNPKFRELRQFPWFQGMQLNVDSKIGTPEQQKLIGDFKTTALKAVAETIMGFKGRVLDKEVGIANQMKLNEDDTIGVMLGKLPSIQTFNEMTKQRARIASKLMAEKHISRGDALEEADKMIDGKSIRAQIEKQLSPKLFRVSSPEGEQYEGTEDQISALLKDHPTWKKV